MKTDVLVIGSGPAGLICSLLASQKRKVTLVEKPAKEFKLAKRILVSGNGRCNFFNEDLLTLENIPTSYHPFLDGGKAESFLSYLKDNGFVWTREEKLYYPFFKRSECLHSFLLEKLNHVEILAGKALSVEGKSLLLLIDGQKVRYEFNELVLAIGGRSLDRDDYDYALLDSLKVKYHPYSPALCPIVVKEKIPNYLNKNRLQGTLTLKSQDHVLFQEKGELLFKEDGISGICVFNSTISLLNEIRKGNKGPFIYSFDYAADMVNDKTSLSCLPMFLRNFLKEKKLKMGEPLTFTFKDTYPFKESQLSYGGILLSEINLDDYSLKGNTFIHVLGEMLDINLPCGGYNMGNAFVQGYTLGKILEG